MRRTLGTTFSVGVSQEVLENARFTESIQTLVDRVCVTIKTSAEAAFQKCLEVLLFYFTNEFGLLFERVNRFVIHNMVTMVFFLLDFLPFGDWL